MRRTAEPHTYNRGKWRFVIFVAGAKAGEHLKIKVVEVATGSTMPKQFLEVQKESEKRKAELISIEISCGAHELPRRCNRGTPNFKGLP